MSVSFIRFSANKISTFLVRLRMNYRASSSLHNNRSAIKLLKTFGQKPELFDDEFYLNQLLDPPPENMSPLEHFLLNGYRKGKAGRFFDNQWYEEFHSDVRASGLDGFFHYKNYGNEENRTARFIKISQDISLKKLADYEVWREHNVEKLTISPRRAIDKIASFTHKPKISVVMPVYNPPLEYFEKAILSVINQYYDNWELCIADDNSPNAKVREIIEKYAEKDSRIKYVFRKENGHISECSNSAIEIATGEFIGLLDHDDELTPDAIYFVVDAINNNPDLDIIYSDEDKIGEDGTLFDPYFKSEFNYELFLAQNMISHFGVYRHSIVIKVNGFRKGLEGSQDHDLALRIYEICGADKIHHIPRILYHWRAIAGSTALDVNEKNYASEAGLKAVAEHLERINQSASVTIANKQTGHYRVRYDLKSTPLISIIIPTKDCKELLEICITSLTKLTTYANYEILIINNNSEIPETFEYFETIKSNKIKIIDAPIPFNFSKLNNDAVKLAKGEILVFLNNDIEIISPDWLEEMLSWAQRDDIGCVGARLWYPDNTIQHAGVIIGMGGVAGHAHKHLPKGHNGYFCRAIHHQAFLAVTAACLMMRREVFDLVGGYEEKLQVAFNDVDLCLKVSDKGYRNIFTPYAELYHHESISRGSENTPQKQARFASEVKFMEDKWGHLFDKDPYYNPNLSLTSDDFSLADETRVPIP